MSAEDCHTFRQAFYADGKIDHEEIKALFDANAQLTSADAAWPALFREVVVDWAVNQVQPEGYMTADNADVLIGLVTRRGRACSSQEFEAVVGVIEQARWCPERLGTFALGAVRDAVVSGTGPLAREDGGSAGNITELEVDWLRRILFASGSDGNIAVTRAEAEILFDINDAVLDQDACLAWSDLFTKAIANAVLAAYDYAPPSREEALRQAAWLDNAKAGEPAFFSKMLSGGLTAIIEAYSARSAEDRAIARLERQRQAIITNEVIIEVEATWLADRLGRDGKLTENETRLVDFLVSEAPKVHPALLDKVRTLRKAA